MRLLPLRRLNAFCLLFSLSWLALAAHAQSLELPESRFQQARGVWLPASHHALVAHTTVEHPSTRTPNDVRTSTRLQLLVVDSALHSRLTDSIRLSGWFDPLFEVPGAHHGLYRYRRVSTDSMLSVVADAQGRVRTVKRQLHNSANSWDYLTLPHPLDGFVVVNPDANESHVWVRHLRPDLTEAWVWNVAASGGQIRLDTYALDKQHLWLVLTDEAGDRDRATCSAICLDVVTGREISRLALDKPRETHRFVTACAPDGAGGLLVAGQAFDVRRPKPDQNGDLFVRHLLPDGTLQPEQRTSFTRAVHHHLQWHHVERLPNGGVRLIGETYSSTSRLVHHVTKFATLIASLGTFYFNHTTLRPRGIVVADLSPTGTLAQSRSLDLPDGAKFSLLGYYPARRIATLATQTGVMQWRGLSPDSSAFLLRSPRRVVRVGLADWSQQTLATAAHKNALEVWAYPRAAGPPLLIESRRQPAATRLFFATP